VLTVAAVLGVLCLVLTAAGAVAGVKPLMYRSGSMAPAIGTGDMSLSRSVAATDVRVGDVVSVVTGADQRVTHRVVEIAPGTSGDRRQLTLKGDANDTVDQEVYAVSEVQRVVFTVPKLGYVVAAASSQIGLFVLGLYVAAMLSIIARRRDFVGDDRRGGPSGGSRGARTRHDVRGPRAAHLSPADHRRRRLQHLRPATRVGRAAVVGALTGVVAFAGPAAAAFSDSVAITGTSFSAIALANPTTAATPCRTVSGSPGAARISWTAAAGTGIAYRVVVTNSSGGMPLYTDTVAGTSTDIAYADLDPRPGSGARLTATIHTVPSAGSSWQSASSVAVQFRTRTYYVLIFSGIETYCA
jgi:signal peptidase I